MSSVELTARLESTVASAVAQAGFELAELQISPAGRRKLVKVVVESQDVEQSSLDLDAVADVSRAVSGVLDDCDDALGGPYTLEVSSPGLDRPLTARKHWQRARLRLVEASLTDGSQLVGRVGDTDPTGVTLLVGGALRRFSYEQLARAVVQVEFREAPAAELRALESSREELA